jgi:predicted transcriptional regulator of viral defense system
MKKKNYLTQEQQYAWEYLQDKEILDAELLDNIFPEWSPPKRNKLLHSLFKKGYLQRAKQRLYFNPKKLNDYHTLAFRLSEGYLGLSSALRFYNLLEYEDFTIFIITFSYRKKLVLKGTEYALQFIPFQELYTGFVKQEKRMNVSLTRAKCALIVIGNAQVLGIDSNWRTLSPVPNCARDVD